MGFLRMDGDMKMNCNQIVFYIITGCTHNCRLCVSGVPYYRAAGRNYAVRATDAAFEIDAVFRLFDYVERITVTGGEPLLHRELGAILRSIMRYAECFGVCRVFTNGSLMPDEELLALTNQTTGKLTFVVNDYGKKLSPYAEEIRRRSGCRVNSYHGESQYFDGWVDYGSLNCRREYTPEDAASVISRCHFTEWKMYNIFQGKLFYCTRAAVGSDLGFFRLQERDFLDLRDSSLSLREMRSRVLALGSFPTEACYYCNGFDAKDGKRYPAAEQL